MCVYIIGNGTGKTGWEIFNLILLFFFENDVSSKDLIEMWVEASGTLISWVKTTIWSNNIVQQGRQIIGSSWCKPALP